MTQVRAVVQPRLHRKVAFTENGHKQLVSTIDSCVLLGMTCRVNSISRGSQFGMWALLLTSSAARSVAKDTA